MRHRCAWYRLGMLGMIFNLVGCAPFGGWPPSAGESETTVTMQLAERQQRHQRSMKLYTEGHRAYKLQNVKEARRLFAKAVEEDDRNAVAWLGLGVVDLERDDYYSAAKAFDRAATLIPTRYEPHFNLGLVYEAVGQFEKAIGEYELALELAPDRIEVMENLAAAYIKAQRKPQRSRELIERALTAEHRPEWRDWLKRQLIELQPRTAANVPGHQGDTADDVEMP